MEHRWANRKKTNVAVRFLALPGTIGTGRVTDISLTGAFIATEVTVPRLSRLYLETIATGTRQPGRKRLVANVVRSTSKGFGIEWREPAFDSTVYAQLRGLSRDIGKVTGVTRVKPPKPVKTPAKFLYRFDFLD